jgi:phosphonate metabolism transcriptional regulator PhnF
MKTRDRSNTPIYRQIAYQVIGEIQSGRYQSGDRLPSENQLAAQYGVHRLTIRQAMAFVVEKGLAFRHQGKGTFVSEPRINYGINQGTNFRHTLLELGYLPSLKILNVQTVPASEPLADLLATSPDTNLIQIKVLRCASSRMTGLKIPEDQPLCISLSYLRFEQFPGLSEQIYQARSLYSLLRSQYGVQPRRTRTQIETESPSQEDIHLLKMPSSIPVLITRGIVQDQQDQPMEYTISRFRGDRFTLEVSG